MKPPELFLGCRRPVVLAGFVAALVVLAVLALARFPWPGQRAQPPGTVVVTVPARPPEVAGATALGTITVLDERLGTGGTTSPTAAAGPGAGAGAARRWPDNPDATLREGAVGVFVGGDFNDVLLERFTIQVPN